MDKLEPSYIDDGNINGVAILKNLNIELLWPRNSTPRYQRKIKTNVHRKTCTWMFIAALLILPNN